MRRKYLRDIDRDIAEEEALETERITDEFERWLGKGLPLSELNKNVEAGERQSASGAASTAVKGGSLRSGSLGTPPASSPASTPDDGYDENDPFDRLRSEGGHL